MNKTEKTLSEDKIANVIIDLGNPSQIKSFANTLANEKRYMDTWRAYGLDDPRTYKDRAVLKTSISKFERLTGLDWPFE